MDSTNGRYQLAKAAGIAANQVSRLKLKWAFGFPGGTSLYGQPTLAAGPRLGIGAAMSAIPGAVFGGGYDGLLRAFSTTNGELLWQFNMLQEFKTVNGIAAKGGSMGSAGPTVAGGMVFVGSGYTFGERGTPGNALLAFTVQ